MELKALRITERRQQQLQTMGISCVQDLLTYYPFRYEIVAKSASRDWNINDNIVCEGIIVQRARMIRLGRNKTMTRFSILSEDQEEFQAISEEVWDQVNAKTYTQEVKSTEEAQGVRASSESDNLLVTAADSTLNRITAGSVASAGTDKFGLYDSSLKELDVYNTKVVDLKGVKMERLTVYAEDGKSVSLRMDDQTSIPEVILTGKGKVVIEGSGAFGMIRAKDPLSQLTIRATGSVKNESEKAISLEKPDGNSGELLPGEQKELVLTGYLIRFIADGEELETKVEEPGAVIEFPQSVPE